MKSKFFRILIKMCDFLSKLQKKYVEVINKMLFNTQIFQFSDIKLLQHIFQFNNKLM